MKIKEIINALIQDFYLNKYNDHSLNGIILDTDNINLMLQVQDEMGNISIDEFVQTHRRQFELPEHGLDKSELDIQKDNIHIQRPLSPNLLRIQMIMSILPTKSFFDFLSFTKFEYISVLETIVLRMNLAVNSIIDSNTDHNVLYETVGINSGQKSFWFHPQDLVSWIPQVTVENIQKILDFLSVDLKKQKLDRDSIYLLYKTGNEYVLPYWVEFVEYQYMHLEKIVLSNLNGFDLTEHEYFRLRGEALEYMVNNVFHSVGVNSWLNTKYVDNDAKLRELDVIVALNKLLINIECKSSFFDIYSYHSDDETKFRFKNAYKRTYESVQALSSCCDGCKELKIYAGRIGKSDLVIDQKVSFEELINIQVSLHPIDYFGTNIEYFDDFFTKYKTQPIIQSFADFYCIIRLGIKIPELMTSYLKKRQNYLNTHKRIRIDVDEIDAFGMLTDDRYAIMQQYIDNSDIDMTFMVGNSAYRTEINRIFIQEGLELIIQHIETPYKKILLQLLTEPMSPESLNII